MMMEAAGLIPKHIIKTFKERVAKKLSGLPRRSSRMGRRLPSVGGPP
jgi:hypothetical protein